MASQCVWVSRDDASDDTGREAVTRRDDSGQRIDHARVSDDAQSVELEQPPGRRPKRRVVVDDENRPSHVLIVTHPGPGFYRENPDFAPTANQGLPPDESRAGRVPPPRRPPYGRGMRFHPAPFWPSTAPFADHLDRTPNERSKRAHP